MPDRFSDAVSYDGDLLVAAQEVIAELDDTDGLVIGTSEYKEYVRQKATEHKVLYKDLLRRVRECLDD